MCSRRRRSSCFDSEKIEKDKYDGLGYELKVLRDTNEKSRILEDDKIVGVQEDYYDFNLLSNCTNNFKKASVVVGSAMGNSQQSVGDTYLSYKVRKLIESGKIEYRGIVGNITDYKIRAVGS